MKNKIVLAMLALSLVGCGKDGAQGPAGPAGTNGKDAVASPYQPIELIVPCGDDPNIVDEVLIRMSNGQILGSFSDNSNGHNTRFAVIPPGTYRTTDGKNCVFTVHADGTVQ